MLLVVADVVSANLLSTAHDNNLIDASSISAIMASVKNLRIG
jgi:hypothetical protein